MQTSIQMIVFIRERNQLFIHSSLTINKRALLHIFTFFFTSVSPLFQITQTIIIQRLKMGCCGSYDPRQSEIKQQSNHRQKQKIEIRSTCTGVGVISINQLISKINQSNHTSYQLIQTLDEELRQYQIQQRQSPIKLLLKRYQVTTTNIQKIRNMIQKYSKLKFPYLLPIVLYKIIDQQLLIITPLYPLSAATILKNKRKGEYLIEIYKIARTLIHLTSISIPHNKIEFRNIFYSNQKSLCPLIGLPNWGDVKDINSKSSIQQRNLNSFKQFLKKAGKKNTSLSQLFEQINKIESLEDFTFKFFQMDLLEEKKIIPKNTSKIINYENDEKYEGQVDENGNKQGYGIQEGENSYWGQWANNHRNNFGNLKTPKQMYVGEWKEDKYNGNGIFISLQTNQFYEGQFLDGQRHNFGIWQNIQGQMYVGEWRNNKKQGEGYYYDPISKFKYEGSWNNDMKNGKGQQYFFQTSISYIGSYQNNLKQDENGIYDNPSEYKFYGSFINNSLTGKGRFQYKNESIYQGQLSNGVYQGKGKYSYKEYSYDGQWKNGCKNGFGIEVKTKQYEYTGNFENNQRNGGGVLHLIAQKMILKGNFQNGKLTGKGQCTYQNGDIYIGEFQKGMKHGIGKYLHNSGQNYQGQWKEDKYHGKGKYTEQNGGYYEGDFIKGKREGKGKQYFDANNWYQGEFKNNKRHGKGIQLQGGDRFEGLLVDGKRHCQKGVMKFKNKDIYEGSFKENNIQGKGRYLYADGNQYSGEFINNKKEGKGKMIFPKENAVYEGDWKDDKREGFGIEIYNKQPQKGRFEGYFKDNKKQGTGIRIYQEVQGTCKMQGKWIKNLREGQFTVTFSDGTTEQRQYLNDREINLGVSALPIIPQ